VEENLQMMTYSGAHFDDVRARAFEIFPRLEERREQIAGTMSGGEQQMLAMARALTTDPALLLLDEISMGLAPLIVAELYESVKRIADQGVAILLTEQYAQTALKVADYAVIMTQGKVRSMGEPKDIAEELSGVYLGTG
jgi:branched-chain amino acid transport system ATP-binding protein